MKAQRGVALWIAISVMIREIAMDYDQRAQIALNAIPVIPNMGSSKKTTQLHRSIPDVLRRHAEFVTNWSVARWITYPGWCHYRSHLTRNKISARHMKEPIASVVTRVWLRTEKRVRSMIRIAISAI
jgi:hypothetical protein